MIIQTIVELEEIDVMEEVVMVDPVRATFTTAWEAVLALVQRIMIMTFIRQQLPVPTLFHFPLVEAGQ